MKELFVGYFHELIYGIPQYVYAALLSVFCLAGVFFLTFHDVKRGCKNVLKTLLLEYSFLVFCSTVIFRKTSPELKFQLTPFWSYSAIRDGIDTMIPETIMNVLMFIPIGLMIGLMFSEANWRKVVIAGVGFSLSTEFLQLIFKKGCFETDDVIHNTIGCMMGYCSYCTVRYLKNKVLFSKR